MSKIALKDLKNITIPIIVGATASGKTNLSFEIYNHLDLEIISADSRQMVKEMNLGTAKPTAAELAKIKHHFIDIIPVTDLFYNAHTFGNEAREKLLEIFNKNKYPLICGGSGLYIQSLVEGFFDDQGIKDEQKLEFRAKIEKLPLEECYQKLLELDPKYATTIEKNNKQRVHRALEIISLTNKKYSDLLEDHKSKQYFKPLYLNLTPKRENLYQRINERVLKMVEMGLEEEVRNLVNKYGENEKRIVKTIGYLEFLKYFKKEISFDETIALIQKNTRHFAKRQITWFKRLKNRIDIADNDYIKAIHEVLKVTNKNNLTWKS